MELKTMAAIAAIAGSLLSPAAYANKSDAELALNAYGHEWYYAWQSA